MTKIANGLKVMLVVIAAGMQSIASAEEKKPASPQRRRLLHGLHQPLDPLRRSASCPSTAHLRKLRSLRVLQQLLQLRVFRNISLLREQ